VTKAKSVCAINAIQCEALMAWPDEDLRAFFSEQIKVALGFC